MVICLEWKLSMYTIIDKIGIELLNFLQGKPNFIIFLYFLIYRYQVKTFSFKNYQVTTISYWLNYIELSAFSKPKSPYLFTNHKDHGYLFFESNQISRYYRVISTLLQIHRKFHHRSWWLLFVKARSSSSKKVKSYIWESRKNQQFGHL